MTGVWFVISAYCACALCTGPNHAHGLTTSGPRPLAGWTAACPPELPFGTRLHVEGFGEVQCEDRGGDIQGRKLDLFLGNHGRAKRWGKPRLRVCAVHVPGLP